MPAGIPSFKGIFEPMPIEGARGLQHTACSPQRSQHPKTRRIARRQLFNVTRVEISLFAEDPLFWVYSALQVSLQLLKTHMAGHGDVLLR